MNPNQIDLKKTGILFFDILNGYYHQASEANRARKKPMVEGAVRRRRDVGSAAHRYYNRSQTH
jgi:hypothetical protein